MYRIAGIALLLLPALPAAGAEDKPKQSPEEQYKALVKDYQADMKAASAQDRLKVAQEKYAPKFLELAENNPKDPAAVDALAWIVTNVHSREKDSRLTKALEILARQHADSPKVGPICEAVAHSYDKESGDFLRAVLDKNPSRDLQGQACLALAEYLKNRNRVLGMLKERPDVARILEGMVGKEYTEELKKLDPAKGDKEEAEFFERAADKYGDVKLADGRTVADKVKPELARVKNLGKLEPGKEAPDIVGADLDGKDLKLSDYRGKVVLLDFWGNW